MMKTFTIYWNDGITTYHTAHNLLAAMDEANRPPAHMIHWDVA